MLALLGIHLLLIPVLVSIGSGIVASAAPSLVLRAGDRIVLSIWLALLIGGNSLLLVSMVTPLTPGVSAVVTATLLVLAMSTRSARASLSAITRELSVMSLVACGGLIAVLVIFASTVSDNIDTGAYHFQFAEWLATYGTVPGVGLILYPLGISTSWLPLTAPFNHGPLEGRCHGIVQSLLFFTFLLHAGIALVRAARRSVEAADLMVLASFVLIWPFRGPAAEMSVNTAVAFATAFVMFTATRLFPGDDSKTPDRREASSLFLLLCCAVSSLKITVLPLAGCAALWFLWMNRGSPRVPVTVLMLCVLCCAAPPLYSTLTTGYPFFVSTFPRIETPWTLPAREVRELSALVHDYWWCHHPGTCGAPLSVQVRGWIADARPAAWLATLSVFFAIASIRRGAVPIDRWMTAVGASSVAVILAAGPSLTYGLGWLTVIPAAVCLRVPETSRTKSASLLTLFVFCAILYPRLSATRFHDHLFALHAAAVTSMLVYFRFGVPPRISPSVAPVRSAFVIPAAILALLLGEGIDLNLRDHSLTERVLLPARVFPIERCEYREETMNDVGYWKAVVGEDPNRCECWSHELPCSGGHRLFPARLLDPETGIAGGFAHADR